MAIPPLILKIIADSSGVKAGVAETNAEVSGLKQSITANATLMKTALVGGVVAGLAFAAKAASDLGESQNKANVIFGDSVGLINNFADSAAEGFGISKQAALESAASFGAMFDSAGLVERESAKMSATMTGLAGDMASFNNQDPSEMLDRLRSGLAGEAEPLRRFGVFISEARVQTEAYKSGIAEVGTELTDAQKIQARYNIIMQDTAKQQGDFARTLGESLPNQIRALKAEFTNLAAEIGQVLLPGLLATLKIIREIPAPVLAAGAALLTLAAATIAVNAAVKALSGTWLARLLGALGPVGAALAVGAVAVGQMKEGWDEFNRTLGKTSDHIDAVGRGGLPLLTAGSGKVVVAQHQLSGAIGTVNSVLGEQEASINFVARAHEQAAAAAREQRAAELSLAGGILGLVGDLGTLNDAQKDVNRLRRQGKTDTAEYRDAVLALATSSVSFEGNLRDYIKSQKDANLSTRDTVGGLVNLGKEFGFTRGDLEKILGPLGEYVRGLDSVPKNVHTKVVADISQALGAIGTITSALQNLQGTAALGVRLGVNEGRQHGGPVTAMRPYIVGEAGPEVFVPRTSGTVVANGSTNGGGDVVLQIHGQTFARITRDELLKLKGSRVSLGLS